MSLRARLTLFYTTLLGAVVLLFGVALYARVSSVLITQVDDTLATVAFDTIQVVSIRTDGTLAFDSRLSFDNNVIVQLWDGQGRPVGVTQSISPTRVRVTPLDPVAINAVEPITTEAIYGDIHLRVLTVPLRTEEGYVAGVIQAGRNLAEVDDIRSSLLNSLILTGAISLAMAAIGGWITTRRALTPLLAVTRTAQQITRADDLSNRIPTQKNTEDEVGRLIQAFNLTLGRLEELFNSQRRFLADVSHELRTPLTVIKGNADLMRRVGVMDEESLDSIEIEIDRLNRMVCDLLLIAQAESGNLPLDRRLVELDTVLLEVVQHAHILAQQKKEVLIGEIDQVLVCGDRDRLKQVILNLASNAVKYTQRSGTITLALRKDAYHAYLSVSDNGPGIPTVDLEHIFDRFYRAEKSRSRSKDGNSFGLGLSIAYWIVNNHGGEIEVESVEGEGTTFTVSVPLAGPNCKEELREPVPAVQLPVHTD